MKTLQSVTKDTPIKKLPGGYGYFVRMFRDQIRDYILRMTAKVMPRVIVVCLIYFPDEKTTGSWVSSFCLPTICYSFLADFMKHPHYFLRRLIFR